MTIRDMFTDKVVMGVLQSGERGKTYQLILSRLSGAELIDIRDALDQRLVGSEIETSSWIPGADWSNTPYQPLFVKAARLDHGLSAKMFGLMVWEAFERHEDDWYSGRFEKDGIELSGRTYFKKRY